MARLDVATSFYGGPGFSLYHASGQQGKTPQGPHFHDEYLISAQLSGSEQCHVGGKLHRFSPGEVVLINPQQVHTGNTEGEDVEYISIYVDKDVVGHIADELNTGHLTPEFTSVKTAAEPTLVSQISRLLSLMQTRRSATPTQRPRPLIADDEPTPEDPAITEIREALHSIVYRTLDGYSNLRQPSLRSTARVPHRKVARVLDFMRSLPAGKTDVSLDRLAEIAELSKFHFLRQFNSIVGMTPGAYLRTLRLCHAARMLRASNTPIVEVALAVGFADHPSFSRAFARQMGMTPSDYRRIGPL